MATSRKRIGAAPNTRKMKYGMKNAPGQMEKKSYINYNQKRQMEPWKNEIQINFQSILD